MQEPRGAASGLPKDVPSGLKHRKEGDACWAALQVQRLQQGASGNSLREGVNAREARQWPGTNEPPLAQGKDARSCSRDLWKGSLRLPLEDSAMLEGTSEAQELEAPLVPAADSKCVWMDDEALAQAISAGLFCSPAHAASCPLADAEDAALDVSPCVTLIITLYWNKAVLPHVQHPVCEV